MPASAGEVSTSKLIKAWGEEGPTSPEETTGLRARTPERMPKLASSGASTAGRSDTIAAGSFRLSELSDSRDTLRTIMKKEIPPDAKIGRRIHNQRKDGTVVDPFTILIVSCVLLFAGLTAVVIIFLQDSLDPQVRLNDASSAITVYSILGFATLDFVLINKFINSLGRKIYAWFDPRKSVISTLKTQWVNSSNASLFMLLIQFMMMQVEIGDPTQPLQQAYWWLVWFGIWSGLISILTANLYVLFLDPLNEKHARDFIAFNANTPAYPLSYMLNSFFCTLCALNVYTFFTYKLYCGFVAVWSSLGLILFLLSTFNSLTSWTPGTGQKRYLDQRSVHLSKQIRRPSSSKRDPKPFLHTADNFGMRGRLLAKANWEFLRENVTLVVQKAREEQARRAKEEWSSFLSYKQDDKNDGLVLMIQSLLPGGRDRNWVDKFAEDRSTAGMLEGVKQSKVFVAIISEKYFTSAFCSMEIEEAMRLQKPIALCFNQSKYTVQSALGWVPAPLRKQLLQNEVLPLNEDFQLAKGCVARLTSAPLKAFNGDFVPRGDGSYSELTSFSKVGSKVQGDC